MADNIDLTNFSEEELIQLNRRIVERLRSSTKAAATRIWPSSSWAMPSASRRNMATWSSGRSCGSIKDSDGRGKRWASMACEPKLLSRITEQVQDNKRELAEVVSLHSGGNAGKLPR